ncbi:hypothetical protein NP233_g208 [Leucocoprinus birnbaumii]|uniref:F-box domain-containing protein n=1 Tax=Leucocoprinus birnbaumii TaxID=56174 RepID=A0AAD5W4J8_9AGAR|nr:hypothetical protein NP233_g208 [Leucocoprinus birnbaumii]
MSNASRQTEAALLRNELQEIDDAMINLVHRRADVCSRINGVCATTSVFPLEILITIFQCACSFPCESTERDPHTPLILASVSRGWRQIIHSTPSLWTSLGILLWDTEYASADSLALIRTYFHNSDTLPVSLRLNLSTRVGTKEERDASRSEITLTDTSDTHLPLQPPSPNRKQRFTRRRPGLHDIATKEIFEFLINKNPNKLRALFIDELPLPWLLVYIWGSPSNTLNNYPLPNIERLHVGMPDIRPVNWPTSRIIPSSTLPRLVHLSLAQNMPFGLEFPYHQLTVLELCGLPINECYRVIRSCTSVVRCYCKRPHASAENSPRPLTTPVTLSHLRTFGWTFGFQQWDEALLKCFMLPALEVFRCEDQAEKYIIGLENNQYNEQSWRNLQSSFLHQSPNLRVFKCFATDPLLWETRFLASDLPQTIQELHLRYVNVYIADDFIRALTPKPDVPVPFPNLRYLSIELESLYWIRDLVLDFLKARRSRDIQASGLQARLERLDLRRGRMGRTGGQMDIAKDLVIEFQKNR